MELNMVDTLLTFNSYSTKYVPYHMDHIKVGKLTNSLMYNLIKEKNNVQRPSDNDF